MSTLSPKGAPMIAGLSMASLGMITGGIGPALPNLAANTSSSLATIGALFSAIFLGGLMTQLLGGPLNDRYGQRPIMSAGLLMMALGSGGMAASRSLPLTLVCALITGMGRGAVSISAHILIARVFTARSAAALNMLNVFFGVGAVAGPIVASVALRAWDSAVVVLWLGASLVLAQLPLMRQLGGKLPGILRRGEPGAQAANPLRQPVLWVCGVLLFFYVGGETGVGGWITTYLEQTFVLDTATSALMAGSFWLAITSGRLIGALVGTRLGAPEAAAGEPDRLPLLAR